MSGARPRRPISLYADHIATHYDVLGIAHDAPPERVRSAYRDLARMVHPDHRSAAAADPVADSMDGEMAEVNEAYRVLSDPERRFRYDRSLRHDHPPEPQQDMVDLDTERDFTPPPPSRLMPAGPARMPWKMMIVAAVIGSAVILGASVFNDPPGTEAPDGILRIGSCVEIQANTDVREIACTNTGDDVVIELFLPLGATCPGSLGAFRDRLGLGTACIEMG